MFYDMSAPVASLQEGHDLIMAEAHKRWPGVTVRIISESDDGVYKARVQVEGVEETGNEGGHASDTEDSNASDTSEKDAGSAEFHIPRFVIVLTGDAQKFGSPVFYNDTKPPFRIATKGDSEDHKNMDKAWPRAVTGEGEIWSGYMSLKYRTDTVVLKNQDAPGYIIEQDGSSVVCDGEPTQANITDCLTN